MYIKSKNIFFLLCALYLTVGTISITYDLPSYISTSRAPWIDESLKNHIAKNIVELGTPQPYADNEFRANWEQGPIFTIWTLPYSWLFGIGYIQIRILSLLTALLAIIFIYLLIRKEMLNHQINYFSFLLFTNLTFIAYSRLGTYESLFLLLMCIIYYMIYKYFVPTSHFIIYLMKQ